MQPVPGQMGIAAGLDGRQQRAEFLLRDVRRQNLGGGVLVDDHVPHLREVPVRESFSCGEQSAPIRPFRIPLSASAVFEFPGDAPADLGDRVVRQLNQMEMIDHQGRVRQQAPGCRTGRRSRYPRGRPNPPLDVLAVLPPGLTAAVGVPPWTKSMGDSSIPRTRTGAGSARRRSACSTNARCAVGQDTPWAVATSDTDLAASPDRRADLGA